MEPIGPVAGIVTNDAHRVAVEIDVSEIAGRLLREAMRLINDYSQQGLTGDALADAVVDGLKNLSDAPVERAARGAASEAVNLGRNLSAQEWTTRTGIPLRVVRTEILDLNTCSITDTGSGGVPRCLELDGAEYEVNSPEYFEHMPPNDCMGREMCRGFYMYLTETA